MPRRNHSKPHIRSTPTRECNRKRAFASQDAAQREHERRILEQPHLQLTIYHCPYCNKWHFASTQS